MAQDPKRGAVSQVLPYVAAMAAAHGGQGKKSADFLKAHSRNHKHRQDTVQKSTHPNGNRTIAPPEAQNETSPEDMTFRCPDAEHDRTG